jgi:hypothetical protein
MMINVRNSGLTIVMIIVAVSGWAGEPPLLHRGEVLDASNSLPIIGVQIHAFYDEWPPESPNPGVYETQTDSTGVYRLSINRPAEVVFYKAGFDSLALHWPEEFEGSDQGGCGITLGPVKLVPSGK